MSRPQIYFSFFMFTADLKPDDTAYTAILIDHLKALTAMGYDGFDLHIAASSGLVDYEGELASYRRLKEAFDTAGLGRAKFTTNVGTVHGFDPTSPDPGERQRALSYLKSRVDITRALGGPSIMSGPFLYPYGDFPHGGLWSDALLDWMAPRYSDAVAIFDQLAAYAEMQEIKLAIEPVKSWETPPPNMVSEVLDFVQQVPSPWCGVAVDTAQVVMESQGLSVFKSNIARAAQQKRLHYVHISAPDRGAVRDSWIPWDRLLMELQPVYDGPYLIEIFNAIPPFDASMRMARRRFWRPGEDAPKPDLPSAYDIAEAALKELKTQLGAFVVPVTTSPAPAKTGHGKAAPLPEPIKLISRETDKVRIHTFVSAYTDNNIADATHIIEGPTKLVIIDGQFLVPYAKKFREYADGLAARLGKTIDRVYLTHRHPDHWFGLGEAFADLPIYALPETIDFLKAHAGDTIASHRVKLGDLVPDKFVIPGHVVIIPDDGAEFYTEVIDGLSYVFTKVVNTEIDYHLIIGLPEIKVCIVQDLIYSETHLYLTPDEEMANWIRFLDGMALSDYDLFLAGHGLPADRKEVTRNIEYLWAARGALTTIQSKDIFKQYMLQRYPARLCAGIFDIYLPRLFDGASQY